MIDKVKLLRTQTALLDNVDPRYDIEIMNLTTFKVSLPLQPSSWKQLTVEAAEKALAEGTLPEFLAALEEKQIVRTLELLGFVNGLKIGTGEMALKTNGYGKHGSDIVVKLLSWLPGRVFNMAVVTKKGTQLRVEARTAEQLLDALAKCA